MKIEINDKYDLQSYRPDDFAEFQKALFKRIYETLDQLGIERARYVLGDEDCGTAGELCLHYDQGLWAVYASERGKRLNPAFFASGWDAARYLMWELLRSDSERFPLFPNMPMDLN
jgi:hypothetical protein